MFNGRSQLFDILLDYQPNIIKDIAKKYVKRIYHDLIMTTDEMKMRCNEVYELRSSEQNLYNTRENANPFPDEFLRESPHYIYKKPFISVFSEAFIISSAAAVVTRDKEIVIDSFTRPHHQHRNYAGVGKVYFSYAYQRWDWNSRPYQADNVIVLHHTANSIGYYHWLIDQLLRLRGVKRHEQKNNCSVDIILSQKHPGFVQKLIDLLGYEENKVITSNHLPIKAKNVLVPSHPEPTPLSLRWLRSTVLSNIDYVSVSDRIKKIASEYDTIFVSRQKSDRRYIENYNEVESVLHKNDIKPIFLEDITIESEIYLLNSISRIIGAHGAGLTCMIWTEDLHTLEIFNGQVIPPFYILSEHLGHEYTAILGEHSNEELTRHSNVIVDVEELQDKL